MEMLAVTCRILIAAITAAAAFGKFSDMSRFRLTLNEFGLPTGLARVLGTVLPGVELLVATGILVPAAAWWGAVAAAGLFASFGVAISVNLALGRKPECNCFGQVHTAPIGSGTLVLNGLLLGSAILLVARGRDAAAPGILDLLASLTVGELASAAAVVIVMTAYAIMMWFLLQLYKQNGRLLDRVEALEVSGAGRSESAVVAKPAEPAKPGLRIGATAPDFALEVLAGGLRSLSDLLASRKLLLLVFVDPDCGPCTALLPDIAQWRTERHDAMNIVVISRGKRDANRQKIANHSVGDVLLQQNYEISNAYQCYGTPGAVLVDSNGLIASAVAQGADQIRALIGNARGNAVVELRAPVGIGALAPNLAFRGLSGKTTEIASFLGRKLLIVFWNPSCGFCTQMLKDLKSWEGSNAAGDTAVLVVSQGSIEANSQMNLRSTIVLDDDFKAGRTFGAAGTPSAVLIDEAGLVASGVAVGATRIFSLLDHRGVDNPGSVPTTALAMAGGQSGRVAIRS